MSVVNITCGKAFVGAPEANLCPLCFENPGSNILLRSSARTLRKCGSCGVCYLDPLPDPRDFSAILLDHYIKDEPRLEHAFGPTRNPVLSRVAAKINQHKTTGRILDVGCAGGHFLSHYFPSERWERFGVEPSKYGAARAAQNGLQVYHGELSSAALPEAFFDVITLLDVICYVLDPLKQLRKLRKALKPGGILVIEQSLSSTRLWRHTTAIGKILGGAPNAILQNSNLFLSHAFLYDVDSMNFLLSRSGFRRSEWSPLPGNAQRTLYRDVIFRIYYTFSKSLWWLSRNAVMLGPNFIVVAVAA